LHLLAASGVALALETLNRQPTSVVHPDPNSAYWNGGMAAQRGAGWQRYATKRVACC